MRRATLSNPPLFQITDRDRGRVTLTADTGAVAHMFVLEEDIVRLLMLPEGRVKGPTSWAICPGGTDVDEPGRDRMSVDGFGCPEFALDEGERSLTLATAKVRCTIQLHGFHCRWEHRGADGAWRPMAQDRPTQAYDFGWWDGKVRHYLSRNKGERYYGLGEASGGTDRAMRRFRLLGLDPMGYDAELSDPLYKSIPYVLVADGEGVAHGCFYDTMADASFDFGREHDNYHEAYRYITAESGDLDLYMIAGPEALAVTKRFTWLTGRPALMPRWSVGYSGSTMTYTDAPDAQAQHAEFLAKLEEHDIGCTSFHLSSGYTQIGAKRYVFNWNRDKFPDPAGFVESYRAAGIELVPNIKPALLRDHPRYAEVEQAGLLITDSEGRTIEGQYWDDLCAYLDFTNPETAAWWRSSVKSALLDYGMRATWNDNNEYGVWDTCAEIEYWGDPRPAAEARPLMALLMSRASRDAQTASDPARRPYVVTRSAMTGQHRYCQTWSGDNRTDWKTIRYNAKMGIGLALSGVSNSGHDVGGFAGRKPEPELFLRWVQAGVLMPRFSIHSWNDDRSVNEPWMYPELTPAIVKLMALRQTLTPFLYDLLWRYHRDYEPVVRPLWLEFPGDVEAWVDGDEHMLGGDLLVALVCDEGVTKRMVRMPAGADWIDVWTGARITGGATVMLDAALDRMPPLLARAGSGIVVDLAKGGFRPDPYKRGVWLFPTSGDGTFAWSFTEDEGEQGPQDIWSGDCVCEGEVIRVAVHRDGPGTIGDSSITVLLPSGETRRLILSGGATVPVTIDGRAGVTLTLI